MNPRPKILLDYGRVNEPIRVPISDLLLNMPQTFLTDDTASGVTSLTVDNGFNTIVNGGLPGYVVIGQVGNQSTEIVNPLSDATVSTLTVVNVTSFPHSASTPVYACLYDEVEISYASTIEGLKTVYSTIGIQPAQGEVVVTNDDTLPASGYYFARWVNSLASTFSDYSDPVPFDSYTLLSARSIIDAALGEINKKTSEVLSDSFAFQQLDMFQTDVLRELKRWSFMQKFDAIIGQFTVGQWKIALPVVGNTLNLPAIADSNTNKSIYNIRVGTNGRLTWIDKEKWDDFIFNLAYSTLSVNLIVGATTMTLVDSSDFTHVTASNTDGSGTVIVGGNSYSYSANNITTGVLTLTTAITSANTATAGQDVFQNANQGLPEYFTVFDNTVWYWPITSSQYDGLNAFTDYYIAQTRIRKDSDEIVVPDPLAASYFLQWKFLKKQNNGQEDTSSQAAMQNYLARREKLKNKEVLNRTFKNHAQYQNFAVQEQWSSGDPRYIRDGNFPNTGF